MGILKKAKLLKGLKSAIFGVTDALGITSILRVNLDSKHKTDESGNPTGVGKIDYIRLVVAICVILSFVGLLKGYIDKDHFKEILKLLN